MLERLRLFVAVARAGSLTRAAAELDLSQPTVSQQIQVLERELRAALFTRLGRGVALTAAGAALVPYAEQLLALADAARLATQAAAGLAARTLRLGAGNTLATYVLPDLLARLRWEQPDIVAHITVGNTEQLVAAAVAGRVELVLVGSPVTDERLVITPFLRDQLVAIVAPDDALAARNLLALADLAARPVLLREPGSALHSAVAALFAAAGCPPARTMTLGNIEAIKRCVEAALGVAVVPAIAVRRETQGATLRALPLLEVHEGRWFHSAHRRGAALSAAAATFVALLGKPFE